MSRSLRFLYGSVFSVLVYCYTKPVFRHVYRLLQRLLENSKYSEWDYLQMDQTQFEDDNAGIADEAQDIAPRFHESHDEEEEEDNEDEDGAGDNEMRSTWGEGWTARKWSARMLDHLSFVYRDHLLPYILPEIESRLQHQDWEVRESAVLVLGAVSRGCLDGLNQYLPKILEILVGMCNDKKVSYEEIFGWYTHWPLFAFYLHDIRITATPSFCFLSSRFFGVSVYGVLGGSQFGSDQKTRSCA